MLSNKNEHLDVEADFDAITRAHRSKVYRFILASVREQDVAETLTQDCFLRAYLSRERFRNECGIETWLIHIAVNLIRDYSRNRRLQFWKAASGCLCPLDDVANSLPTRERSPERKALLKECLRAVWTAADRLSRRQRTVFMLRFGEDMNLLEIAAVTGMKEGTVKSHLNRALQRVREQVGTVALYPSLAPTS